MTEKCCACACAVYHRSSVVTILFNKMSVYVTWPDNVLYRFQMNRMEKLPVYLYSMPFVYKVL